MGELPQNQGREQLPGMVDHKGVLYAGEHDRIIDQETWDQVHETLRHNGSTKGATVRNKLGALLRGQLFCVPCGTPMMHTYTMRKSKRYRYYVCYNAQQQGWQNCETKSVSAQAIETAVLDSVHRGHSRLPSTRRSTGGSMRARPPASC